jgi:hypothetical protein
MTQSILSRSVRPVRHLFVVLIALGAASCGGGGGGGGGGGAISQDPTVVAPSVFATVASFIGFLNGLAQSDNSEPLGTGTGAAPTSDRDEPTNIS